jgi:NIMA (never in mitosis gene a)-related kinase
MSLNSFQILEKLGEGAYSSVFKARRITDEQIYALKKVRMGNLTEKEIENALTEVRILASIHNPYIISYKEVFIDAASQTLWYAEGSKR